MVQNRKIPLLLIVALLVVSGLFCTDKKEVNDTSRGSVTSIAGDVQIYKASAAQWDALTTYTKIDFGDSIKTGAESQVEIRFTDEYSIKIQENSKIVIPTIQSPK